MAHYSATVTSAGTTYLASADATIPFEPGRVELKNLDATNGAYLRFGDQGVAAGGSDEVYVAPSSTLSVDSHGLGKWTSFGGYKCEVRIRSAAGTPAVVLNAEA